MTRLKPYLYVRVVKVKDVADSCCPCVEVRLGNYMGTTRDFDKKSDPDQSNWNHVFAFSRAMIDQASVLEVTVKASTDDFVGWVLKDLSDVPKRVPMDSPVAAEWYRLEDRKGGKVKGEVMLAVWWGTQSDEVFLEAWHSYAAYVDANLRSRVYLSPKLWYLRVKVIKAQILMPSDKNRTPEVYVKAVLGMQTRKSKICMEIKSGEFAWNETLMFVAAEPFDVPLSLSLEERIAPNWDDVLGMCVISLQDVDRRSDDQQAIKSRWFNITKESEFAGRIHVEMCMEGGYHVPDESSLYTSDFRPSSTKLWKKSVGVIEVGILSARGLQPMKVNDDGRHTTDAYCVVKYGRKWVRTRTITGSFAPEWNEHYAWEVYDPCTVLTIGVFDNCHLQQGRMDTMLGKVRIRLSTLETDYIYSHAYPLLILGPSGVRKMGEIVLAVRFTCTSFLNMMHMYTQPLLPEMHHNHPSTARELDLLRHNAVQIVSKKLSQGEPPLRREVVEYMLDVDSHMLSLRRSKCNFFRIMTGLAGFLAIIRWFNDVCNWKNPITTLAVHIFICILVLFPKLILPSLLLGPFLIGAFNHRYRSRIVPHLDIRLSCADNAHPDELDEEFDSYPTSRPYEIIRMRYDRLRTICGRLQTMAGDAATQLEKLRSILSWRDPRATTIFMTFCLFAAILLYATPFHTVVIQTVFIVLRHPMFRHMRPSAPANFFRRLPSRDDCLL